MRENADDRDVAEACRAVPRSDDDPLLAEAADADIVDADSSELHVAGQIRVELDARTAIRGSSGADDIDVRDGDAGRVVRGHARRLAGGNDRATRAVRRHDDREWPGSPIGRVERERTGERLTTREVHTIARAERSLVDARERPPRRRRRGALGRIAARGVQIVVGCGRAAGDGHSEPHTQEQLKKSDELAQFGLRFRSHYASTRHDRSS